MEPTTLPELAKKWPELSRKQIIWKALNVGMVVVKAKRGIKVDETTRIYRQKVLVDKRATRMKTRAERAAEMAAMRPEHTLKQIGEFWGLTRERVRQILRAHGYGDLTAHPKPRIEKHCEWCDVDFGPTMGLVTAKARRFCSRNCNTKFNAAARPTLRQIEIIETTLKLRKERHTWAEISKRLGLADSGGKGTALPKRLKEAAKAADIDVSAAFGFYTRGPDWYKKKNNRAAA